MKLIHLTWKTVTVPEEIIATIRAECTRRNAIRIKNGLSERDLEAWVDQMVGAKADAIYESLLRPYVVELYKREEGSPGMAGRITQHIRVYSEAEILLRDERGIVRPRPVKFDMAKFVDRYSAGTLTEFGGCFTPIG